MDDTTRNRIKQDIRSGYDPTTAGARAGLGAEGSRYHGEQLANDVRKEDSQRLNEILFSGSKTPSDPVPSGAIGALVLIGLVAMYFSTIVSIILLAVTLVLIVATIVPAARGWFPVSLAVGTLLGAFCVAALIYGLRGGEAAATSPSLGPIDLPEFATGDPRLDAVGMGLWLVLLLGVIPGVRPLALSRVCRLFLPLGVALFTTAGKSAVAVRLAGLLLFGALTGIAASSFLLWADASWVLRSLMLYAVAVMINALWWSWRETRSPEHFMALAHHMLPRPSLATFNKDQFRRFLDAKTLEERHQIERHLIRDQSRLYSWVIAFDRTDGYIVNPIALEDRRLIGVPPAERPLKASVYALHDSLQTQAEKEAFAALARQQGIVI